MPTELYSDGTHRVLCFDDLVTGDGIQANQFLIIHGEHTALLDPGGSLTYTPLTMAVSHHIVLRNLEYVLASHQDPDIITSLDRWLMYTDCKVVISKLWERFLPHLVPGYMRFQSAERIVSIPDHGMDVPFGDTTIKAVPAHFLHSVGNFSFYDPTSRILFSGDIGAAPAGEGAIESARDFERHAGNMLAFHRRYMNGNAACRYWTHMVRDLDLDMIVPQHGPTMRGPEAIGAFLGWLERLECGMDLMNQQDYRVE